MKPTRQRAMESIFKAINQHGGKLLDYKNSAGAYWLYERNRDADQRYYMIRIRGNYITVNENQYLLDGEPINTFMSIMIPGICGEEVPEPVTVRREIVRLPIKDHAMFKKVYEQAAPSLGWRE